MINKAINNGLSFLSKEQNKDVGFGFEEIFPSILILDCLNELKRKKSKEIAYKIVNNLLKEKSQFSTFNYWFKKSKKFKNIPYPDDLDDSCCALSSLYRLDNKLVSGDDLAKIANVLILCEEKVGGPYRTWILPKEKSKGWDDVDLAVNSNVAYFLNLQEVRLKNINKLIEEAVVKNKLNSPFYKGEIPVIYFICRFYKGKFKNEIKNKLLELLNKTDKSLDQALIICSLVRLGFGKEISSKLIRGLINKQGLDGSWEADDLYFSLKKPKKMEMVGSKSLTTGFVIEALDLYLKQKPKMDNLARIIKTTKREIKKAAMLHLIDLDKEIREPALVYINKTIKDDKDGIITLTPYFMAGSLDKSLKKRLPSDLLVILGVINLYGWIAYTIYDHIIDGDIESDSLPIANVFCREMEILFNNLPISRNTGFFEFYKKTMQEMEAANFWELKNCEFNKKTKLNNLPNFSNYENLAKRSIGHCLTSVAILCFLGFSIKSGEVRELCQFFKYFLISRQMNDDIHDWQEDLKNGKINSAGKECLELLFEKKKFGLLEPDKKEELSLFFWQEIVPGYCQKIIRLNNQAEKKLNKIILIKKNIILKNMLKKIKCSASRAIAEREKTLSFINNYY